ncbi:MAG: CHASE2 domain-containing protein [Bacteroidetes bacterium]|nr:MAG: CHASE2 domain-containing protein [Bacteroidota bacterium]
MALHHHIARHTKRYVGHITKYLYERDTIFSLLMVFLFIIIVKFIPLNLHVLDPMKLAIKDFDLNDIAYAKAGKADTTHFDTNIEIVNIGHIDRAEIAMLIEKISSMRPKVMGLDAYFEGPREAEKDSLLSAVFKRTKNLVTVSRFDQEHLHHKHEFELLSDYFDSSIQNRGYANLIGEEGGTIRMYSPFEKVHDKEYPSFTSSIIRLYNEKAYERLEKRHNEVEMINYTRRYSEQIKNYKVREYDDIMLDRIDSSIFKDKIVLLAYVSDNPFDVEDKKFTPMNENYAGKTTPDMNGIIVHANIISMVIENNYIRKVPEWVGWLVAIFIGWLHMSLFIRYYLENHIWFHLVAKIAQLFSAFFFAYLGFRLFDRYGVKLEMELTLVVIILAVDIIYFYEAIAVWMHKKFKFATVFTHHHHPAEGQPHGQEHTNTHEHH